MSDFAPVAIPTPLERAQLEPVEVPNWGVTLYVRLLSARDVLDLPDDDPAERITQILLRGTCQADGSRLWTDDKRDEVLAYPAEDLSPLVFKLVDKNGLNGKSLEDRQEK